MNRLEHLIATDELAGKRIIVTGCGYKPARHTFTDIVTGEPSHDAIVVDGVEMKLNIGAATAGVLALHGATVHMLSTSAEKLEHIAQAFEGIENESRRDRGSMRLDYSAIDLLDKDAVAGFVDGLPKDKPIYWVQSVGLGAGSYSLKDDNPYLPIDEIPIELLIAETTTVLQATHLMMQALLPRFREQRETRIAIITSMSAIRGYTRGATHCTAKGAIDRYANAAMLELYKDNIFVTTIRPGAVDTGMYDHPAVQEAILKISDTYDGQYRRHFCLAPPTAVGMAIANAFSIPAHLPSIDMVAKGQFPNEGS